MNDRGIEKDRKDVQSGSWYRGRTIRSVCLPGRTKPTLRWEVGTGREGGE